MAASRNQDFNHTPFRLLRPAGPRRKADWQKETCHLKKKSLHFVAGFKLVTISLLYEYLSFLFKAAKLYERAHISLGFQFRLDLLCYSKKKKKLLCCVSCFTLANSYLQFTYHNIAYCKCFVISSNFSCGFLIIHTIILQFGLT